MEIITAVGDVNANINPDLDIVIDAFKDSELKIVARTRIELDGDIMVLLPTNNYKKDGDIIINQELLSLHKDNVDVAVKNWNSFVNNMFFALRAVFEIAGVKQPQALDEFNKPVEVEGRTQKS